MEEDKNSKLIKEQEQDGRDRMNDEDKERHRRKEEQYKLCECDCAQKSVTETVLVLLLVCLVNVNKPVLVSRGTLKPHAAGAQTVLVGRNIPLKIGVECRRVDRAKLKWQIGKSW